MNLFYFHVYHTYYSVHLIHFHLNLLDHHRNSYKNNDLIQILYSYKLKKYILYLFLSYVNNINYILFN